MIIDDELLKEAQRLSGLGGKTAVIHEGLRALIARESARRLAALGGSEKALEPIASRLLGLAHLSAQLVKDVGGQDRERCAQIVGEVDEE